MRNLFISKLEYLESGGNHPVTSKYKFKKTLKSWSCLGHRLRKPRELRSSFPSSQPTKTKHMKSIIEKVRKEVLKYP